MEAVKPGCPGQPKSEEHRKKMSDAQKKRMRDPEEYAKFAYSRTGIKQTDEHKAKRLASRKVTLANRTPEQKLETRIKIAKAKGSIVTIDGVEYLSLRDAADKLGTTPYLLKKAMV